MVSDALDRLKLTSALRADAGPEPGFWISEADYRDMQLIIRAYQLSEKFATIVQDIMQHHMLHPEHGIDCACMDKYIEQLRILTKIYVAQDRFDYVLRKVLDR